MLLSSSSLYIYCIIGFFGRDYGIYDKVYPDNSHDRQELVRNSCMISTLTILYDIYFNFIIIMFISLIIIISIIFLSFHPSIYLLYLFISSLSSFYLSYHIILIIITFLIRFGYGLIRVIRTVIYTAYKSILRISFVVILMVILIKGGFYILVRIHVDCNFSR